ncbi:MAG: hypothetical protein LBU04_02205 [Christensenellaceae bacterium]|jgi:hypothetical protein|nr:hypothetical protein [Christensenellaceae bacterium]
MLKKDYSIEPPQLNYTQSWDSSVRSVSGGKRQGASVRQMPANGPVPINPVPTNIQLTPIVQPVAFVPYSSQEQPLFTFDTPENELAEEAQYPSRENVAQAKASSISGTSILIILFILISFAVMILPKFVPSIAQFTAVEVKSNAEQITDETQAETTAASDESTGETDETETETEVETDEVYVSGFELIESLLPAEGETFDISVIFSDLTAHLRPLLLIAFALFAVLSFLFSLFGLGRKGASAFVKILTTLMFLSIAGFVVYGLINTISIGIGAYIVAGLSTVLVFLVWLAKRGPKKVKA